MKLCWPRKPGIWLVCLMALLLSACQDSKVEKLLNQANEEWVGVATTAQLSSLNQFLRLLPPAYMQKKRCFAWGDQPVRVERPHPGYQLF